MTDQTFQKFDKLVTRSSRDMMQCEPDTEVKRLYCRAGEAQCNKFIGKRAVSFGLVHSVKPKTIDSIPVLDRRVKKMQ